MGVGVRRLLLLASRLFRRPPTSGVSSFVVVFQREGKEGDVSVPLSPSFFSRFTSGRKCKERSVWGSPVFPSLFFSPKFTERVRCQRVEASVRDRGRRRLPGSPSIIVRRQYRPRRRGRERRRRRRRRILFCDGFSGF